MAVKKRDKFAKNILEILSDGIMLTDAKLNIQYVNNYITVLTGFEKWQLIGKSLLELHKSGHKQEIKRIIASMNSGEETTRNKTIFINNRFLNMNIQAIYKNGEFCGVVAEFNDVTAIKQRQQSHDNLYKIYTMMFNYVNIAMLTIDKTGVVTSFNPAAEALFGIPKANILNRDLVDVIFDSKKFNEDGEYTCKVTEALETGKEYSNLKKELIINNKKLTALIDTCVLQDASGKVLGAIGIFNDITDYNINEKIAYGHDKYTLMTQLAAGLADEMRNPLTSVKGFMQLIHNRMRKTPQKEYVELALDELKRMEKHIRNFLLFTSPDSPMMKLESINKLLNNIVKEFKVNAGKVEINVNIPEQEYFMCMDEEQIKQAISNILQNAIEAVPAYGGVISVQLTFAKDKPFVCILISDNGGGIKTEYWSHIFEPFFTTKEFNSGLGLTIAHKIITAHGGTILGYNTNDYANFEICLPFGAHIQEMQETKHE